MDDCDIFQKNVDDVIKCRINDFEAFKSLKTDDDIIHFKLFHPLLTEVIQEQDQKDNKDNNKIGVIKIAKIWDEYMDPYGVGDISSSQWIKILNKLNIELNESEIKQIFIFIDYDETKTIISKTQFILFCTIIHSDQLKTELQSQLLQAMYKYITNN